MHKVKNSQKKIFIIIASIIILISLYIAFKYIPDSAKGSMELEINEQNHITSSKYFIQSKLSEGLWGLDYINFDSSVQTLIQKKKKLKNIKVAIIDTGIDYNHPDLKENIVAGYDFVNNTDKAIDDYGHGTEIAGIIGGKYTGIAYGVKIMPVKILNSRGLGKTEDLVKGIIWAVDNGADIINLSIGRKHFESFESGTEGVDSYDDLEYKAIKYALLNNVVMITVSGDYNEDNLCYPAAYEYKNLNTSPIIVSGVNSKGEKSLMANYHSNIDVVAPSEYILTTVSKNLDNEDNDYINIKDDGYIFCQGTSFAGAYVSGLAAIIKSFDKDMKSNKVKKIISSCTNDIGKKGKDEYFGYGIINIKEAVRNLMKEGHN